MAGAVGKTHGRSDLERCGLFWEMSYMNGPYVKPLQFVSTKKSNKPFPIGYPKWKTGLQDCYFEKEPLKRIFIGESFWDELREYYREQIENTEKNRSKNPFISLFPLKASSTPGDYHGTFEGKNFPAFSPVKHSEPEKESKRGIYTQFPKKGTYGFINYTFAKFPEYKPDYYDAARVLYSKNNKAHKEKFKSSLFKIGGVSTPYFDPNPYLVDKPVPPYRDIFSKKKKGDKAKAVWVWAGPTKKLTGDKDGCFDKYPPHSADKYLNGVQVRRELDKRLKKYVTRDSGKFTIPAESKQWLLKSTVVYNVKFKVHAKNWKCARPFVVN